MKQQGNTFLETWLGWLLEQPLEEVDRRYGTPEGWGGPGIGYHYYSKEAADDRWALEGVQGEDSERYEQKSQVGKEVLRALHSKLRGARAEGPLWHLVISELGHALPEEVAEDLVDRGIAWESMGHSRQSDQIQWRLAEIHNEALLTLGVDLYTDPRYEPSEFRALLEKFATGSDTTGYTWLLDTLVRRKASSREKEWLLGEVVDRHPNHEQLRRLMEETQLLARAQDPSLGEDEMGELVATGKTSVWNILAAREDASPRTLRDLYTTGEPRVLERLAGNPSTPGDILAELAWIDGIARQKHIRQVARKNLRRHGLKY